MQYEKYFSIYSSDDLAFRKKDRKRERRMEGGKVVCQKILSLFLIFKFPLRFSFGKKSLIIKNNKNHKNEKVCLLESNFYRNSTD